MKQLLFTLIIISILTGCKTEKQESKVVINELPLKTYFQNSHLPAVIMGYSNREGKMDWYAFGPSVWGGKDTINENNIFRIFSMTKAIGSVAALQLVEKGLIGLDDPLDKLMPEMTSIPILTSEGQLVKANKTITLRNLLTHTSGFGYDIFDEQLQKFDKTGWEYDDLPRLFEAGEKWHYGRSTDWVGRIVEKVSGQNLEDYFREHITGPLKMNSTWFNVPDKLKENIVSWGTRDSTGFKEYPRIPTKPTTEFIAGEGLFGSPKDYLTFLNCIMNSGKYDGGQILKSETVDLMFKDALPDGLTLNFGLPEEGLPETIGHFPDESDTYSLAWAIENNSKEMVRTTGSIYWAGVANSYYTLDRDKGMAIVYFTQFLPFNDKISYDFYRLFEKEVYTSLNKK
ncbi:serine hydrolase domain-containing protein [Maribacter flavus]|uniref:Beta-lactamase family protein n=1 Tax=Maribacter flavus TaxID=1658664 RepID=A0A5B2TRM6_9FLAO|nr:serine hydrolase domain-containing protein [Maribacter flavus]KAA2217216.1 beta-lactamase family protein [Maribacter flavus]